MNENEAKNKEKSDFEGQVKERKGEIKKGR